MKYLDTRMARPVTKPTKSSIQIALDGEKLNLTWEEAKLDDVQLDENNPRIRHLVELDRKAGKHITQPHLHNLIWKVHGVEELAGHIRNNGGTLDPIWLRHDNVVVEGNCRTVSYRYLNEKSPKGQWAKISAFRLPNISEKKIDVLLGILHVQGKINWRPYEKAGHIHRLVCDHGISVEKVAKTFRIQKKAVEANIGAYELMRDEYLPSCKDGDGLQRFSYFLEFYKDPKLESRRDDASERKQFVDLVKSNSFPGGVAVRKYRDIIEKPAALKKLKEASKDSFSEAMKIVAKTNPSAASKLVEKVETLARDLKNAQAPELENFNSATGRKLLESLHVQIRNVAKLVGADTE